VFGKKHLRLNVRGKSAQGTESAQSYIFCKFQRAGGRVDACPNSRVSLPNKKLKNQAKLTFAPLLLHKLTRSMR
jgi:hypothetical protein